MTSNRRRSRAVTFYKQSHLNQKFQCNIQIIVVKLWLLIYLELLKGTQRNPLAPSYLKTARKTKKILVAYNSWDWATMQPTSRWYPYLHHLFPVFCHFRMSLLQKPSESAQGCRPCGDIAVCCRLQHLLDIQHVRSQVISFGLLRFAFHFVRVMAFTGSMCERDRTVCGNCNT